MSIHFFRYVLICANLGVSLSMKRRGQSIILFIYIPTHNYGYFYDNIPYGSFCYGNHSNMEHSKEEVLYTRRYN